MKILMVSESYWPNVDGGAIVQHQLVRGLHNLGDEVSVWAPGKYFHSYVEDDDGVTVYRERSVPVVTKWYFRVSLWPYFHAFQLMKWVRPDVVHIQAPTMIAWAAILAAKYHRIPILATNHLMPENVISHNLPGRAAISSLIWKIIVATENRADYVTAPSPLAMSFLKKYGLKRPHDPISNGIDTQIYQPGKVDRKALKHLGVSDDHFMLFVGRLDQEKRIDLLISAMPVIIAEIPNARLVIAGTGAIEATLKAQVALLGLKEHVSFAGRVDDVEKVALYRAAAFFAIASPAELQSIVTLEAMACGKSVIAVNAGALPNLVKDHQNGFLFPLNNVEAIAKAAVTLFTDDKLRGKFGKASLDEVMAHHANYITYQHYHELYEQLSGHKPAFRR